MIPWHRPIFAVGISIAFILPAYAAGESEVEAAIEAASDYRYGVAFEHYRIAARLGNVDAQRSGGLMALYGEVLYGTEIHADRAEALQWLGLAAKAGCEICAYVLAKRAAHDATPVAATAALAACQGESC